MKLQSGATGCARPVGSRATPAPFGGSAAAASAGAPRHYIVLAKRQCPSPRSATSRPLTPPLLPFAPVQAVRMPCGTGVKQGRTDLYRPGACRAAVSDPGITNAPPARRCRALMAVRWPRRRIRDRSRPSRPAEGPQTSRNDSFAPPGRWGQELSQGEQLPVTLRASAQTQQTQAGPQRVRNA